MRITDNSSVFNTDLLYTIELGHGLNVAECMAHSAIARKESRGAHQRLDEGCTERDDVTSSSTPSPSARPMALPVWNMAM